jgi:hypothetical protein
MALEHNPDMILAYFGLGQILLAETDLEAALCKFEQVGT